MFRKITNSAPCPQPLQEVETTTKEQLKGGVRVRKTVTLENPQQRISFDEYSLEDLLATGVKLEQVNTKVIENNNFDSISNVPRETQTDNEPF